MTRQLVSPSSRMEPSMVRVRQCPPGAWSCSLWPPRTRPRSRVMLVLAEDSVDEDQPIGRPLLLHGLPKLPLPGNVSAILFAGTQRFFYSGSPVAAACGGW